MTDNLSADHLDLTALTLEHGAHETRTDGVCLLEAVAWIAGESHTDNPACVSPVLGEFGRRLNDVLPHGLRQQLVPLVPLMPGTAGDGWDEARGYLALDWLIRTYTPAWLELAGLAECAAQLRALRRIVDLSAAQAAGPVVRVVRERSAAAGDAAGDAAWDAARDAARDAAGNAARDAAWDAARDAAWDAARAAAGNAAWDAAGAAAWDAAGDAAWDAARAAARDAAWAAARDAAWDAARAAAWDAAWDAARASLQPTIATLQASAIHLLHTMINPAQETR